MHIEFFGAAGEVTGSCHVLRVGGKTVLLDCGLIQGSRKDEARNRGPFPFDAERVDAVVLSHAHLDHCGRLPLLVRRGFRGPIFAHQASCELATILLADAAKLEERDAEYLTRKLKKKVKPLFTLAQGEQVIRQMRGVKYRERIEVVPGVSVRFRDAGHILGSCAVEVWLQEDGAEKKIVFSGDLGQYDTPILKDPEPIDSADAVLMESTYGNRRHRERDATVEEIGEIIARAGSHKGNILIPAFAIGRTQEVLYQLGRHFDEWGLDRFKIFLDSPMAIEARLTIRLVGSMRTQTAPPRMKTSGSTATMAPQPVETPLPPLKRRYSGKQCPRTAAEPATRRASSTSPSPAISGASTYTGNHPLRKSSANATTPHPLPRARMVLVAPMLPLPTSRTSIPLRTLARSSPKGMLPSR